MNLAVFVTLSPLSIASIQLRDANVSALRQQLLTEQGTTSALNQELGVEKQKCLDIQGKLTADVIQAREEAQRLKGDIGVRL